MKQSTRFLACMSLILSAYAVGRAQKPEIVVQTAHYRGVNSVAFSSSGKLLASAGLDSTVRLWDVASGKELRTFFAQSMPWSVALSGDGRTLAAGLLKEGIKLWDVTNGAELRSLFTGAAESDYVVSVVFSPDGKTLASGSWDSVVRLWDVASGKVLRKFTGHSGPVWSVSFSSDGKILASGGDDNTLKLWDVESGAELRTFPGYIKNAVSSADRKTLAAWKEKTIKVFDAASGKELHTLEGHSLYISCMTFSPDGKILASGSHESMNPIKLWDVDKGEELRSLTAHSHDLTSVAISSNDKYLAVGDVSGMIKVVDLENVNTLMPIKETSMVDVLAFSPDAKVLASLSLDSTVKLWDVGTGRKLQTLGGDPKVSSNIEALALDGKKFSAVRSIAFSADGEILVAGGGNGRIRLWDARSGRLLKTLVGHSGAVMSVSMSADGGTLASRSADKTIKLWNVTRGQVLRTLDANAAETRAEVTKLFPTLYDDYRKAALSNGLLARIEKDGAVSLSLLDKETAIELAKLFVVDENDWLVTTADGLFDGSPNAWGQLLWRFNNDTFNYAPVEAFFSDFYYPGLLTDILAGKNPTAPSDISRKDRRQPQLRLTLDDARPGPSLAARNLAVKIDVSQAPAGAQDVRLFRNGSLVKAWRGDVLNGQSSVTLKAAVPIVAGENRLTAYAFNHDNIKSGDARLVVKGAESLKRPGTAYILAVGVSSYSNAQYNLTYAVADAQEFSAIIKQQQEGLKRYGRVEVIPLYDREATKANILRKLAEMVGRVQPEDAVIVYFAGHGTAQQNRFYLIPHDLGYDGPRDELDEAGLAKILAHSISDRELEQAFEKIDSGQLLLVIDACNSGQALEAEEKRRGPMNSKGLAQLAYEKGMYILTAAQSYQAALEASVLGHGYLTYALVVEGLGKGKADAAPKDGSVLVREWLDYATARVPQMQMEKLDEAHKAGKDFTFVEGLGRGLTVKTVVQRPRVFYRRELESSPLVVGRGQAAPPKK